MGNREATVLETIRWGAERKQMKEQCITKPNIEGFAIEQLARCCSVCAKKGDVKGTLRTVRLLRKITNNMDYEIVNIGFKHGNPSADPPPDNSQDNVADLERE